jgi:hypothetical protein
MSSNGRRRRRHSEKKWFFMIVHSHASMFVPGVNDIMFRACANERVLNEIVGVVAVPAKRNGESAKTGHCRQHGFSDGRLQRSDLFAAWKVEEKSKQRSTRDQRRTEIVCIDRLDSVCMRTPAPLC